MGQSPTDRFITEVSRWDVETRISCAQECISALTHRVSEVLALHESNKIILYSDALSSQIPRSRAGVAFNIFRNAMYNFEIIRLVAIWDKAGKQEQSIPTAIALIDDKDVLKKLADYTFDSRMNRPFQIMDPSIDPAEQELADDFAKSVQRNGAARMKKQCETTLAVTIERVNTLVSGDKMEALKNARHHLAHSLSATHAEIKSEQPIPIPKLGDEKIWLDRSIKIIEDLYCWVNGTSFDIQNNSRDIARKQAEELWGNCHFERP